MEYLVTIRGSLRKHTKWNVKDNIGYERKCYWNEDMDVQMGSLIILQENEINNYNNIYHDVVNYTSQ